MFKFYICKCTILVYTRKCLTYCSVFILLFLFLQYSKIALLCNYSQCTLRCRIRLCNEFSGHVLETFTALTKLRTRPFMICLSYSHNSYRHDNTKICLIIWVIFSHNSITVHKCKYTKNVSTYNYKIIARVGFETFDQINVFLEICLQLNLRSSISISSSPGQIVLPFARSRWQLAIFWLGLAWLFAFIMCSSSIGPPPTPLPPPPPPFTAKTPQAN